MTLEASEIYATLTQKLQFSAITGSSAAQEHYRAGPDLAWVMATMIDSQIKSGAITRRTPAYEKFVDYAQVVFGLIRNNESGSAYFRTELEQSLQD